MNSSKKLYAPRGKQNTTNETQTTLSETNIHNIAESQHTGKQGGAVCGDEGAVSLAQAPPLLEPADHKGKSELRLCTRNAAR